MPVDRARNLHLATLLFERSPIAFLGTGIHQPLDGLPDWGLEVKLPVELGKRE